MHSQVRTPARPRLRLVGIVAGVVAFAVAAVVLKTPAVHGTSSGKMPAFTSLAGARTIVLPAGVASAKRTLIDRMTVHHTESGSTAGSQRVDAKLIGQWHEARHISGPYHGAQAAAYHFIILPDGTVQAGRPLNVEGSGTMNMDDNRRSIGVALVGDFSSKTNHGQLTPSRPTAAQLRALTGLALWAFATFHFGPAQVHGHREVAASDCPGNRFDLNALRKRLAAAQRSGQRGVTPPIVLVR
jgi:hypothetical protein